MSDIVIIDYGMGNIRSIIKAFKRINVDVVASSDSSVLDAASKLILPGVGHFKNGMQKLHELKLIDVLNRKVLIEKIPILGICLGMQLFTKHSEEGQCEGLGWIDAKTIRFRIPDNSFKIPHMGWNTLVKQKESSVLQGIGSDDTFYFVHSYHVVCDDNKDVLCNSSYNINFTSVCQHDNITGMQFHPEKSHKQGLSLLKNFILA